MTMPDFFIVGAIRSGTTSIYNYLMQHPEVYVSPVKEPNFFLIEESRITDGSLHRDIGDAHSNSIGDNHSGVTDLSAYQSLFSHVRGEKAVGEASVSYLTTPGVPERIYAHIPSAKLIAILRNPIDRAFSSFLFHIRINRETIHDFMQALQAGDWRLEHYIEDGMYFEALRRYLSVFRKDQIFICLYDDFVRDPLALLQGIFGFLGVDRNFTPDMSIRYNVAGIPKRRWLHHMIWDFSGPLKRLAKALMRPGLEKAVRRVSGRNLHRPKMDPQARRYLLHTYEEDISRLQGLIGRDLSHWLESAAQERR